MNARHMKTVIVGILCVSFVLVTALTTTSLTYAATASPFVGTWYATDWDGSQTRLVIAGRTNGPFKITITDDYISFCKGGPGIIRGNGWLNQENPDLLEADLRLVCFNTGDKLDYHYTWRYHHSTSMLSSGWQDGRVIIWHKYGQPIPPPPELDLRVNYNNPNGWVEGFYEAGHSVWITVTGNDGFSVKATAELFTEPKDFWGGEPGFNLPLKDWMPEPPVIEPDDWVYAWVDNGATAKVQIGDIKGAIDLAADSITGYIIAPWISEEVVVECHPWGAPEPGVPMKYDVFHYGGEPYSCSWLGEWDIQPGQDVGVSYFSPEGHWVANAFRFPNIIADVAQDWFHAMNFAPNTELSFAIIDSVGVDLLFGSGRVWSDNNGNASVSVRDIGIDMLPGYTVVVRDDVYEKELLLQPLEITVFDPENDIMAGNALPGAEVSAAAGYSDWQQRLNVQADPNTGAWLADFTTIGYDITEEMRPSSFAQVYDEDGDANEGSTPPLPVIVGSLSGDWFWTGAFYPGMLDLFIYESGEDGAALLWSGQAEANESGFTFVGYDIHGQDLVPGNYLVVSDGVNDKELVLQYIEITVFDPENEIMAGFAFPGSEVSAAAGYSDWQQRLNVQADPNTGAWLADFTTISYDITEEMRPSSFAQVYDEDGDANEGSTPPPPPNPFIVVSESGDWFWTASFNPGLLDLYIYESADEGAALLWSGQAEANESGFTFVGFDIHGLDLVPGNYLVVSDGVKDKEIVLQFTEITVFDPENDIMAGNATPGAEVSAAAGYSDWQQRLNIQADPNTGAWLADFTTIGYDITEEMRDFSYADVYDEDGDVNVSQPPPRP